MITAPSGRLSATGTHWAAVALAAAVVIWSAWIWFIMFAGGVSYGDASMPAILTLFAYPVVIACFLWRGVTTRNNKMTTISAWLYITAPGLFMGLYVPPFAAALLAAFLQSRDTSNAATN